ncbi:MAG: C-GCAxxG-C-C family protein, partial [Candidatus Bathyarchaeia archaeon]
MASHETSQLRRVFNYVDRIVGYNAEEKLNCAENVFITVYDLVEPDFPRETVALTSGFGGGLSRYRSLCGALSGAVAILGMFYGRRDPFKGTIEEREEYKRRTYEIIRRVPEEFKNRFGSLICSELIGEFLVDNRFDDPKREKMCRDFISFSSKSCLKILFEENKVCLSLLLWC